LHRVPIAWKLKQQGGVTLSSSEAEYYAISEVAAELKFISMIMEFIELTTLVQSILPTMRQVEYEQNI
jgi:hypothetical protein